MTPPAERMHVSHVPPSKRVSLMRDNSLTTTPQEPWPRFSGWPPARSRASSASTTLAPPADHFTTVHTDPADLRKLLEAEPAPNCTLVTFDS